MIFLYHFCHKKWFLRFFLFISQYHFYADTQYQAFHHPELIPWYAIIDYIMYSIYNLCLPPLL
jgi:hypothetical protein